MKLSTRLHIIKSHRIAIVFVAGCFLAWLSLPTASARETLKAPTLDEVLASPRDLWGLAAMREPNGASYEFFEKLLPPLRYVNAAFRHYPIVLSAPNAPVKARLISNGSAINARADLNTWKEVGTPVSFFVGAEQVPFGGKISALDGPRYERGYLPIVRMDYRSGEATYREETFAAIDLPDHAVVCTRFSLKVGKAGSVAARIAAKGPLHAVGNAICDDAGGVLISFDKAWQWNAERQTLTAELSAAGGAALAIATVPLDPKAALDALNYDAQKDKCVATWEALLAGAMHVEVPEPVVNAAWKSTIVGSFLLLNNDRMNYSAGNAYEVMFEAECGDVVRALMLWRINDQARRMIPPLLDYAIPNGLPFHDSAFKLQLLAHYYSLTRDAEFIREQKPRWARSVDLLTRQRDPANGLLPREQYCGDELQKVFSLSMNANAWRGLRDMSLVLEQIGERDEARRIKQTADTLRKAVLAAVDKSERRDVQPPFIPVALFGEEKPYDMLTATRPGTYWNLMIQFVIGSGFFDHGSDRETWMMRYVAERGGLCMGMLRIHQHSGLFANEDGIDDLYGLRYVDALLRRDEPERAIAAFYGKLAQGMTRDTFLSAEGTGLRPLDEFGRAMYLPPTCSGNALFLWPLRSMLVQDYDLDNTGEPKILRLLFATPRRWLEDGKEIIVENAPTAFGEVSIRVKSRLSQGEVLAEIEAPRRNAPDKTLLRIRVPDGWKIVSAMSGGQSLGVDAKGTIDVSALKGRFAVALHVERR